MGPPPFGSGNYSALTGSGFALAALQWGHRLSAVETARGLLPNRYQA